VQLLRSFAYQWAEPESLPKETDVAANALAFLGLGFYPVVPGIHENTTIGFGHDGKAFRWPLWECELTIHTVGALLAQELPDSQDARVRSASALFESRRFSSNKRLYFSPSWSL